MSELIRREDALRRIGDVRELIEDRMTAEEQDGNTEQASRLRIEAYGMRQAMTILRALPAIGTCATCCWSWGRMPQEPMLVCGGQATDCPNDCEGCVEFSYPWVLVKPDFFCAEWRAKA